MAMLIPLVLLPSCAEQTPCQKYDAFLDRFKNRQADLEHLGEWRRLAKDCANSNGTPRDGF
jgi:hypothetical protein